MNHERFAHLMEHEKLGQILSKFEDSSYEGVGAEIAVYVKPPGLEVCALIMQFEDSDEGWEEATRTWSSWNDEQAVAMACSLHMRLAEDNKGVLAVHFSSSIN